jgi:hypothetical protein
MSNEGCKIRVRDFRRPFSLGKETMYRFRVFDRVVAYQIVSSIGQDTSVHVSVAEHV